MVITSIDKKKLLISLAIPLAVGALASFLNREEIGAFAEIRQPMFAPPQILFPIVWTILYLLMGVSFYLIRSSSKAAGKREATILYALQLAANFIWTFLFFGAGRYFAAWVWILLLLALIVGMLTAFFRVSRAAAYLQIPYLVWVGFACVLNYQIFLLN